MMMMLSVYFRLYFFHRQCAASLPTARSGLRSKPLWQASARMSWEWFIRKCARLATACRGTCGVNIDYFLCLIGITILKVRRSIYVVYSRMYSWYSTSTISLHSWLLQLRRSSRRFSRPQLQELRNSLHSSARQRRCSPGRQRRSVVQCHRAGDIKDMMNSNIFKNCCSMSLPYFCFKVNFPSALRRPVPSALPPSLFKRASL